ncbi:MAG: hypothetical protein ACOVS5_02160, partial [Oligoflexus sp.]
MSSAQSRFKIGAAEQMTASSGVDMAGSIVSPVASQAIQGLVLSRPAGSLDRDGEQKRTAVGLRIAHDGWRRV